MNPITTNIRTFSSNYSFIANMFVFPFLLEKHPLLKVESYVTQILEIKKSKNWYFEKLLWYDVSNMKLMPNATLMVASHLTNIKDYKTLARN